MLLSSILVALAAISQVAGHGDERSMHPREIARRQLEANERHVFARKCAPQIAAYRQKRKLARRSLKARGLRGTTSALEPHETTIKNDTCITAPEVIEGPYYINNDVVRQDLREGQVGILLELDIGVIDTSTCEPLPDALVELWHCNSTGQYAGYTTADTGATTVNATDGSNSSIITEPPSDSTTSLGAIPSDFFTFVIPSPPKTDNLNFLRGGWPTNDQGIVTFTSIYPGYYTGRAVHIHVMVHHNITYNTNGTYSSHSGSVVHVGQLYFDDALNDQVLATSPYNKNTQIRTRNDEDLWLPSGNANGYSSFIDASLIGSDLSEGVLGFITVGVDSTASYDITSDNYYATGELYEPVSASSTSDIFDGTSSSIRASSSTSCKDESHEDHHHPPSYPTHQSKHRP